MIFPYVVGAPAVADAGKLVFVLAGKKEVVQEVIPFTTDVMGRAYLDLSGQAYGKASTLKLIGNAFVMSNVEALAEGLTLADKSGLGVDNYHSFIELMFPFFSGYSTRMRSGDYHKVSDGGIHVKRETDAVLTAARGATVRGRSGSQGCRAHDEDCEGCVSRNLRLEGQPIS